MEIKHLVTFRTVANLLSFRGAAASLGLAQSSVTAQIQLLEQSLAVKLFERLGRQVVLTDAGKRLLEYAPRLIDLSDETRLAIAGDGRLPRGRLKIGAPELLCNWRLIPVMKAYRQEYPGVQLTFCPGTYDSLAEQLGNGQLDAAFVIGEPLEDERLISRVLCAEPIVLICAPDHPLAKARRAVTPELLAREVLLISEPGCGYRRRFEKVMRQAGAKPSQVTELSSIETIRRAAAAGLGIGVMPVVGVEQDIAEGKLRRLAWAGETLDVQSQMAWHKDKWRSPELAAFEQAVQREFPARISRSRQRG